MITREEAAALLDGLLYRDRIASHAQAIVLACTVVALYDERDALALEIRRLRAAEAPGTDAAAFAGTGWTWSAGTSSWEWSDRAVFDFGEGTWGWSLDSDDVDADDYEYRNGDFTFALDAMRAAVPGSV